MSDTFVRQLCRCTSCRRWWSVGPEIAPVDNASKCPCGGTLELADLEAHMATLPYSPFDPNKK